MELSEEYKVGLHDMVTIVQDDVCNEYKQNKGQLR